MLRGATSAWPSHAQPGEGHKGDRRDPGRGCTTPPQVMFSRPTALSSPRRVKHSHQREKKKKSCNNPRAQSNQPQNDCRGQSLPPVPGAIRTLTGRDSFTAFTPWAVLPAGRTSRCCQLPAPANVGKADPNTEPHAPNTICLPSPRCQRRRQPGTRRHTGRAIPHSLEQQFQQRSHFIGAAVGGAGRALNTPCVTHVGHRPSTALGTRPAGPHQAGDCGSWLDFPAGTHQASTS